MRPSIGEYFSEKVIPLIAHEHAALLEEMSVRVEGSVGEQLDDEWSDLDVTLFLPEKLWRAHGGRLQLSLQDSLEPYIAHPRSRYLEGTFLWWDYWHSEIGVHPLSELLAGEAETFLAGECEVPWEKVPMPELLQLQVHPILYDGKEALGRLREATREECYPEKLWIKELICQLVLLAGKPEELEKAVRRNKKLEAQMVLGEIIPWLFNVVFLINRQYYPWRGSYWQRFKELPFGPEELSGEFEILGAQGDWEKKPGAVKKILRVLTEEILKREFLSREMLSWLFLAQSEKAWDNPKWRENYEAFERKAEAAGSDEWYGWIWKRWGEGM